MWPKFEDLINAWLHAQFAGAQGIYVTMRNPDAAPWDSVEQKAAFFNSTPQNVATMGDTFGFVNLADTNALTNFIAQYQNQIGLCQFFQRSGSNWVQFFPSLAIAAAVTR